MSDLVPLRKIRWWPVAVVTGLFLFGLCFIWGFSGWTQSLRINGTMSGALGALSLLLLWFLFFSRLPRKVRLIGLACLVGLCLFLYSAVEIREVSGDVMPILAWSWTPKADEGMKNTSVTARGNNPAVVAQGNDYPRFLGAQSTGVVEDIKLARDWEARPPLEKWRIPIGAAWSGFAVKDGLAVTQEQRGEMEMVTCYKLATGALLWAHGDSGRFDTTVGGIGPRATPTIADGKVYTVGALGLLNCLELSTGKLIWQKDMAADNKAEKPPWGYSSSPLVMDGGSLGAAFQAGEEKQPTASALVVVSPGGPNGRSLVAYHGANGAFAWAGGSAKPGYSSPHLATLAGSQMVLIFNNGTVAGHHPGDGRILWEVPWLGSKPSVANPRSLSGDRVLVSAGYGIGSKMYRIAASGDSFSAEIIYESPRLKAKFANFVVRDDQAYGLDDGVLTCFDTATGERVWKKGRYGHGQLMLVGDVLLVQAERGDLHLLEASIEGHKSLASMPVLSAKSWNTFALAGNLLLMRNHKEAVCLQLPTE